MAPCAKSATTSCGSRRSTRAVGGDGLSSANASTVARRTAAGALARTVLLARDFVPAEVSDAKVVRALRTPTVCIVADESNLASCVGQTVVVTLAQLVTASGAAVRLALPEVALVGPQP